MFFFLASILCLFTSRYAHSYTPQVLERLANNPKWIKLLHYKPTLLGGMESEADGKNFFIHPKGKTNPVAEIKAAAAIFSSSTTPDNNHLICKFPLRYKWLNSQLGQPWKASFAGCTTYIDFFSKLAAKRASIVFSSYYLSNPNSAFGHTFMRLSRYDDINETEMLDYGINYSAQSTATNPFTYAIKGLFGGFKGKFAAIPYYYKVREYSNAEFRDLWSFDLKLSFPQVLEIVDHIWELGDTWFDYFYFQENCSYHLLSVIDVVAPEYDLTSHYPLFTIPADTIRGLKKAGLISSGKRRESTYTKLVRLSDKLTNDSLKLSKTVAENPKATISLLKNVETKKAADILDVAIEAFDYQNSRKILSDDPKFKALKENILRARAQNPEITNDDFTFGLDQQESPALSHAPTRFGLSQGYEDRRGNLTRFELRTSFHDLLDPPRGSMKNAQIEMGKLAFKLQETDYSRSKFRLDQFTVLSIRNFQEQNFWATPYSWEIELGATQLRRLDCQDCPMPYLSGSIGNSVNVFNEKLLMAFLLNGEADWQNAFQDHYRLGVGPKFYARLKVSDRFVSGVETYYHFNTFRLSETFAQHQTVFDWENRYHWNESLSFMVKAGGIEYDRIWRARSEIGLQYFY